MASKYLAEDGLGPSAKLNHWMPGISPTPVQVVLFDASSSHRLIQGNMKNTLIGWCDHTINFWRGCNRVSEGCRHCYIQRRNKDPFHGPVRTTQATWRQAAIWDREAVTHGTRPRVFTCSLSDFFHPTADPWRKEAWALIRKCGNLDWLILTKRSDRIAKSLPEDWGAGWDHVWLGVTVESQEWVSRVADLLVVPAKTRFVSAEPLLGPVDLRPYMARLNWVIAGCERAAKDKRRPMNIDWVRDLRHQCDKKEKAFFFKQYYVGTGLYYDGILDGEVRQDWPVVQLSEETR